MEKKMISKQAPEHSEAVLLRKQKVFSFQVYQNETNQSHAALNPTERSSIRD